MVAAFALNPLAVWAQAPTPAPSPGKNQAPSQPSPLAQRTQLEKKLIKGNIAVSEWFDGVAEGLDLFLVGRRVTQARNETSVRIENATFFVERETPYNTTGLVVIPKLPNLEKYWKLKFTSYDERRDKRGFSNTGLQPTPRERNYGATVGLFRKLGDVRTAFEPRIELQDPLKISHSLTFESIADLKTYEVNPKLQLYASPTRGTGVFVATNIFVPLTKVYSLTFINEGDYEEKTHVFSVLNGVSLGQMISDESALAYNIAFNSSNKPGYHLDKFSLSVAWSQVLYKRILDYQITPHLDFEKHKSFTGVPGLIFNVNVNF